MRAITAGLSLAFCVLVLLFWSSDWSPAMKWGLIGVWLGLSLVWLIISIVGFARAKRDLALIEQGPALVISPAGIRLHAPRERQLGWHEISSVRVAGMSLGAGPDLVIGGEEELGRVPLSFLDALPGSIDSALRAYSLGRVSLDLSSLDSLL